MFCVSLLIRINNFPSLGNFAPTLPLEPLQATVGKLMVQTCHKVEKSYNLLVNFQLVADSICRTAFSVVANGVRGTKSKSLFPVTYKGQPFAKFVAFGRLSGLMWHTATPRPDYIRPTA